MRALMLFLTLATAACAERRASNEQTDVRIEIEARKGEAWRIGYRFSAPVRRVDFGPSLDGFRSNYWRVETGGATLAPIDGRDVLMSAALISTITLLVEPRSEVLPKDYQVFTPMGERGVLLYTGRFVPFRRQGARMTSSIDITAPEGSRVSVFGRTAASLHDWRSPYADAAFVYVGPQRPVETEAVSALVDARAPEWIRDEFLQLAPRLLAALGSHMGRRLKGKPNLFLAAGDLTQEGKLSIRGDALPGQFQATLEGAAWLQETEQARRTLRQITAHEAAHLFQLSSRAEAAPDWIHEGGAESLADEALVGIGLLTADEAKQRLGEAIEECGTLTQSRSLTQAEADGDHRASYACGHVLTVAAAGSEGAASFWRELLARADEGDGYDLALFFATVRERAGAEAEGSIRRFISTSFARPERELRALLDAGEASDLDAATAR